MRCMVDRSQPSNYLVSMYRVICRRLISPMLLLSILTKEKGECSHVLAGCNVGLVLEEQKEEQLPVLLNVMMTTSLLVNH